MGFGLIRRSEVYVGTLADLQGRQLEDNKLAFATDTQQWFQTTVKGLGSDVLTEIELPTSALEDEGVTTEKIEDEAVTVAKLDSELGALRDPGRCAVNVLRVASDVVGATDVVVGADEYEIEIVNTDSTDDTDNGDFDNVDSPLTVVDAVTSYPGCTFAVGTLIRIENEILRVSAVEGDDVTFLRAQSATTAAAHADASDIFIGNGVTAGAIAVGLVTTLTPTAYTAALVADANEHGTEAVTWVAISVNEVLIVADAVGAVVLACTESLGGANNAWAAAAMYGGAAPATKKLVAQTRVPNATEVALGNMHFQFDAAPTVLAVEVRVTATGVVTAWGGSIAVSGNRVTLTNGTDPDWATTSTVKVLALLA